MIKVAEKMEKALIQALSPTHLVITDDSDMHAGHSGAREGGQSHFTVEITADAFTGANRVARHRLVNTALAELLKIHIHALAIKARAPGE